MFSVDSFSRSRFSPSRFSTAKALLASLLLLAGAALLAATPAAGQDKFAAPNPPDTTEAPNISGQVSGGIIGGVPVGGLRNNVGTGAGIRLSLAGWMDQRPVLLGLDLGFFGYGHVEEEVPFSSTVGPRVPVEVSTSNNVLETHLTARLQSRTGRFRPYAEALAGFKYLFTRTRIDEDDFGGDLGDEVASSTNFNDFALSGGVGAGIDIQVYRQDNPAKQVRRVDLHLGVQYLLGQEAEYLTEGALSDQNGNGQLDRSELDIRRSRTTFLQPTFGVTIRLADTD
ncbi:hypothetical protein GGP85_003034 [Salinibacter ruber]|uniref:hypothetical protein n=1 Tax=Salinibacter ruber TaxID=146919 RepID=UPI0021686AA6|nr:hypothetical protein [Salinibacter ruber]MCS3827564.1 hypothetical protein [Salinibacter ruber]